MICECGKPLLKKSANVFRKTCGDSKCIGKRVKHTEESKAKLRLARLTFLKNNPEKTAWRTSNLSYPEKVFLEALKRNGLDKKHLIVREKSVFPYFIDFAFEDQMVAIEIDGSQHLNADRAEKDKQKDQLLIGQGWRVIRIPAVSVINDVESCMKHVTNFLTNAVQNSVVGVIHSTDSKRQKLEQEKQSAQKLHSDTINKLSLLDFSKQRWTHEAAHILGIKAASVRRWIRREAPDLYKSKFAKSKQRLQNTQ